MIYRTDYHIHTRHSDGHGEPEEYVSFALKENISELGFSDHLTLTDKQQDWSIQLDRLDRYIEEILVLKSKTKDIKIMLGIEADYLPGKEDEIQKYIDLYPFDYVIGSVHYMDGPVDNGTDYYKNKNLEDLFEKYFKLIARAAASGLFDIIGHPDLVRIYNYYPGSDIEHLYRELAAEIKRYDLVIELNTNGKNKPLNSFYPNPDFLHLFREEGVGICVNSDSHYPSLVGQHFNEAYDLLIKAGYKEMATFSERKRSVRSLSD